MQKRQRIPPQQRDAFAILLRYQYEQGASVRTLVAEHGRSYGNIHKLLAEAGTTMRPRGGNNRRKPS